jgi:Rha family phage regulatory protein
MLDHNDSADGAPDNNLPIRSLVAINAGKAIADSRIVAKKFGKRHDNVLRDIDGLVELLNSLVPQNRGPQLTEKKAANPTIKGVFDRYFELDRDAFTLLAMGFTGKEAMRWKIEYIRAFNAMESELRSQAPALPDTEDHRTLEHADRRFREVFARGDLHPDALLQILFGENIPFTGDEKYRFFASSVCGALGIADPKSALDLLPDSEKTSLAVFSPQGQQRLTAITESGLYLLAFSPRTKPLEVPLINETSAKSDLDQLNCLALCYSLKTIETFWYTFEHALLDRHPKDSDLLAGLDGVISCAVENANGFLRLYRELRA